MHLPENFFDTSGVLRDETGEFSFVLRPSPHDGVGVFCTHGIRKGTRLRLFPGPPQRFFGKKDCSDPVVNHFCHWYGLEDRDGCHVPHDFGCMEIGWYLNHAQEPNACHDASYGYFATRDIAAGEEITVDYDTLLASGK